MLGVRVSAGGMGSQSIAPLTRRQLSFTGTIEPAASSAKKTPELMPSKQEDQDEDGQITEERAVRVGGSPWVIPPKSEDET